MAKLFSCFILLQASVIEKNQLKPSEYAGLEEPLSSSVRYAAVKIYGLFSSCMYVKELRFVIEKQDA